jgi:hypothetical protein
MSSFTYHLLRPLALGLVLFTLPISNALAGRCGDDIRQIDEAIKNQYGGSGAWWEWFACQVCLGSELKKDAVVTKEQIRDISSKRNLASLLERDKKELMCVKLLEGPKRQLRIN